MNFTPIGQTGQTVVQENQSAVGNKRGATESTTALAPSSEIAAYLSRHTPADMDKMAVSRASSHNVALAVKTEGRYPTGPNGEILPAYHVAVGCVVDGTEEDRAIALADLRNFMTPAPKRNIENWLAELDAISAKRKEGAVSAAVRLEAYASRLAQYPADVAKYAVLKHPWKFWPTWAELEQVCNANVSPRRAMIRALEQPVREEEETRRRPTDSERQRMADLIADKFPTVSQAWRDASLEEITKGNCMTGESE